MIVKQEKLVMILILLSIVALLFTGCTASTQEISADRAMLVRQPLAEETCCTIYMNNLTDGYYRYMDSPACCKNTTDETSCYKCIIEKRAEQREQNIIAAQNNVIYEREYNTKKVFQYALILLIPALFILLIVDKMLLIGRGKGFIRKEIRIALWILMLLVLLIGFFSVFFVRSFW